LVLIVRVLALVATMAITNIPMIMAKGAQVKADLEKAQMTTAMVAKEDLVKEVQEKAPMIMVMAAKEAQVKADLVKAVQVMAAKEARV
jgi:hypothetical protein